MNGKRMKKSPNTDDVSLRSAQSAGLGRKMGGDEANITKKLLWGTSKWLATPSDGRNIAIPPKKAQYDLIDNNSNGKSRFKGFSLPQSVTITSTLSSLPSRRTFSAK
jgi:hypothetical protein